MSMQNKKVILTLVETKMVEPAGYSRFLPVKLTGLEDYRRKQCTPSLHYKNCRNHCAFHLRISYKDDTNCVCQNHCYYVLFWCIWCVWLANFKLF